MFLSTPKPLSYSDKHFVGEGGSMTELGFGVREVQAGFSGLWPGECVSLRSPFGWLVDSSFTLLLQECLLGSQLHQESPVSASASPRHGTTSPGPNTAIKGDSSSFQCFVKNRKKNSFQDLFYQWVQFS